MKTIGVLGGTFNPIHNGHLEMASNAHEQFNIPEILIMPTSSTYYKDGSALIDSELRMNMIRLALSEAGTCAYMKPSYIDLNRGGVTYTCDTIRDLKAVFDKIYFIIGADSLMYIDKWKNADLFLSQCTLLVALRKGFTEDELFIQKNHLERDFRAEILFLKKRVPDVSSSDIRMRIKEKKSVENMLPESVVKYIIKHKLYI